VLTGEPLHWEDTQKTERKVVQTSYNTAVEMEVISDAYADILVLKIY